MIINPNNGPGSSFDQNHASGYGPMPPREFWNISGRAGRINQQHLGIIGIAVDGKNSDDAIKAMKFVDSVVDDVISVLVQMLNNAMHGQNVLDLKTLAHYPEWSNFVQYLAHMYDQQKSLQNFISHAEITLRNTYGYHQLEPKKKPIVK